MKGNNYSSEENNYNSIAWCYDLLCSAVFGSAVKRAQVQQISFIDEKNQVLIVGGGTGWILEEIAKVHYSGLSITYIDASSEMIRISKSRKAGSNSVEFINEPVSAVHLPNGYYDVIITSFFFDNFSFDKCKEIFEKLNLALRQGGKWFYSDFKLKQNDTVSKNLIVKIMYLFFRITCRINARRLPDADDLFKPGYGLLWVEHFSNGLIESKIFGKNTAVT